MTDPARLRMSAAAARAVVGTALILVSLATLLASPAWIDRAWAGHVHPWASAIVVPATERPLVGSGGHGLASSWAWAGAVGLLALGAVAALAAGVRAARRRTWGPLRSSLASLVLVAGVLAAASAILWLPSLRRPALPDRAQLATASTPSTRSPGTRPEAPDVDRLTDRLVATLARALEDRAGAGRGDPGPVGPRLDASVGHAADPARGSIVAASDVGPAARSIARSLTDLVFEIDGVRPRVPQRLKAIPPGALLRFGFAGVLAPPTLEAHVDAALPPWARLAVGAHELAHASGTGREDDAEVLGWLAGLRSGHAAARYATALSALQRIAATGDDATRARIAAALPAPAAADLEAAHQARLRHERPGLSRLATGVYDRWLRRTGQERGLETYDAAVGLLMAFEAAGWLPDAP